MIESNLNLVSATGEEEQTKLPCVVYVHGESYEWNSGNPYDGTVLASSGRVIVVTINFRLGVLGKSNKKKTWFEEISQQNYTSYYALHLVSENFLD